MTKVTLWISHIFIETWFGFSVCLWSFSQFLSLFWLIKMKPVFFKIIKINTNLFVAAVRNYVQRSVLRWIYFQNQHLLGSVISLKPDFVYHILFIIISVSKMLETYRVYQSETGEKGQFMCICFKTSAGLSFKFFDFRYCLIFLTILRFCCL